MCGSSFHQLNELIKKLESLYQKLTEYRSNLSWRFIQGNPSNAHNIDFDDSSWSITSLPKEWDPYKGDVWIRCHIEIPDRIEGIEVSGSRVEVYSSVMMSGGEVFVDSKMVLKEDYWVDFRGPRITITEKAKPGEKHLLVVHIFTKRLVPEGEKISIPQIYIAYEKIENIAFEIECFIEELKFAQILPGGGEVLKSIAKEFDVGVFSQSINEVIKEIEKNRHKLRILSKYAKEYKVHLIAHAHIDMNWIWPWNDTLKVIERDFSTMVSLMERHPDFHFSQSQAVVYKVTEERFPELFKKIKEKVLSGNWDITAAMWVEADLNMIGTEALVRHIIHSKGYIRDKFGFNVRVGWEPDTFGHVWTLPQVLKKSGVDYYYFMRCGKGYPIFWWEGPDGSRILAFNSVYNNVVTPKNIAETARTLYERYGLKTSMFVYGVGNHGGGATIEDIKATIRMREKPTLPSVIFSSTHGFFDEVLREKPELPVVRDELNFTFDGCYTTHADIKRYNRICERYLVDAEKFATIVGDFPKDDLKKAWEKVLFNQFHDILDGSAFHEAYYYSGLLAEEALKVARDLLEKSLKKIASNIKFAMQGIPIVVFNTLAWDRKDVVRVRIAKELIPENPTLIDLRGEKHHVQIDGDELMFIADVPSLGYSTYYLIKGKVDGTSENKEQMVLENEFLKVEIDKNSGAIKSIYDKRYGRFVTNAFRHEATRPEMSNLFQVLYEAPHDMSAWIIGPITHIDNLLTGAEVELVTHGPVMSKAISTIRYKNSKIIQEILLYKEMPRIDFVTKVDWREKSNAYTDAPMLKVSFSPILGSSVATFEIPFGSITRVADGREFPALRWIDLSDNEYGVSLLNDCKHGFDVSGNIMRMTILRTSCSPDPTPDQGFHELKYSLYPHAGDWRKALTFRAGCEINHPLEAVIIDRVANDANLPEEMSFLRIRPENMVLSCLKMAEDGDEIIIRVYDATGEGGSLEVDFGFPVKEANEVDLVESKKSKIDLLNESLRVKVGPSEIKTISIKRV